MKFLLAPDSFKGSLSAKQAVQAMSEGIRSVIPKAEILQFPIADGGEGTLEALLQALGGEKIYKQVPGPYKKPVKACYLYKAPLAVIELAQASGLTLSEECERNPMHASTYGTGLLIRDALERGATEICLTLGGSATNDGGVGIARALGISLLDARGEQISADCAGLEDLLTIDGSSAVPQLAQAFFTIACDVKNPLCGPLGASAVYGPQKGADAPMIKRMDELLHHYGLLLEEVSGRELITKEGSGAAGGAALPLLAFANARICSGIDMVLETIGFDRHLEQADYVFTGEGKVDVQTGFGKAISGIAERAEKRNVPVIVFAGKVDLGKEERLKGMQLREINSSSGTIEEHMAHAYENLRQAVIDFLMEEGTCRQC